MSDKDAELAAAKEKAKQEFLERKRSSLLVGGGGGGGTATRAGEGEGDTKNVEQVVEAAQQFPKGDFDLNSGAWAGYLRRGHLHSLCTAIKSVGKCMCTSPTLQPHTDAIVTLLHDLSLVVIAVEYHHKVKQSPLEDVMADHADTLLSYVSTVIVNADISDAVYEKLYALLSFWVLTIPAMHDLALAQGIQSKLLEVQCLKHGRYNVFLNKMCDFQPFAEKRMVAHLVNLLDQPHPCGLMVSLTDSFCYRTDSAKSVHSQLKENAEAIIKMCIANLEQSNEVDNTIATLANLAQNEDVRPVLNQYGIVKLVHPYLKSQDKSLTHLALSIVAMLVASLPPEENDKMLAGSDLLVITVERLLETLNASVISDASPHEVVMGIRMLALNDHNCTELVNVVDQKLVPALVRMVEWTKMPVELSERKELCQEEAISCLWNLCFKSANLPCLQKHNVLKVAKKLAEQSRTITPVTLKSANGIVWEMEGKAAAAKLAERKAAKQVVSDSKAVRSLAYDVMISYNWGSQDTIVELKRVLQDDYGLKVWLDIEEMGGSTLEAMAKAVENSHIILMCVSRKYKESANCRAEAEYAYTMKKKIVICMVEEGYKADGWLGMVVGAKLYYELHSPATCQQVCPSLAKELQKQLKLLKNVSSSSSASASASSSSSKDGKIRSSKSSSSSRPSTRTSPGSSSSSSSSNGGGGGGGDDGENDAERKKNRSKFAGYGHREIRSWLKTIGLSEYSKAFEMNDMNGRALMYLRGACCGRGKNDIISANFSVFSEHCQQFLGMKKFGHILLFHEELRSL